MGERIDKTAEIEEKVETTSTEGMSHDERWERLQKIVQETSEQMKETDRRMKETDRRMRETDRKMKQLFDQFTTQWGRVVEEVAKPAALKLFKDIGIDIDLVFQEPGHRKR